MKETLPQARAGLHRSLEDAETLAASLDAVITIDNRGSGRVVEFDSAAQTIFGYRRMDAVGRQLVDLITPPHIRDQARAEGLAFGKRFDACLFGVHERPSQVGASMHSESAPGTRNKFRPCAPLANGEATKARMEA